MAFQLQLLHRGIRIKKALPLQRIIPALEVK